MNIGFVVGFTALAVGSVYLLVRAEPADVYPLAKSEAYAKLAHASLTGGEYGVFRSGSTSVTPLVTGNGIDQVEWSSASGTGNACTLQLTAVDDKSTRVGVSCGKPGDSAAVSFFTGQLRNKVIEAVDANLRGRSYDIDKAKGATAWRWPADSVHHADFAELKDATFQSAAKSMDAMAKAQDQAQASSGSSHYSSASSPSVGDPSSFAAPNPDAVKPADSN